MDDGRQPEARSVSHVVCGVTTRPVCGLRVHELRFPPEPPVALDDLAVDLEV